MDYNFQNGRCWCHLRRTALPTVLVSCMVAQPKLFGWLINIVFDHCCDYDHTIECKNDQSCGVNFFFLLVYPVHSNPTDPPYLFFLSHVTLKFRLAVFKIIASGAPRLKNCLGLGNCLWWAMMYGDMVCRCVSWQSFEWQNCMLRKAQFFSLLTYVICFRSPLGKVERRADAASWRYSTNFFCFFNVGEHGEVVHVPRAMLQTSSPTPCCACPWPRKWAARQWISPSSSSNILLQHVLCSPGDHGVYFTPIVNPPFWKLSIF